MWYNSVVIKKGTTNYITFLFKKGIKIMPHEVESMFAATHNNERFVPWHYELTKDRTKLIQEAVNSKEALEYAGLNWTVESAPIYDSNGNEISGYKANTRSSDKSVLGVVTDKYKIVQNNEAFDFTDNLIGEGVSYETAGSLRNGKTIWLLAKMPERNIIEDKFDPYICFTNSHDGKGAIQVCMTPIRVVCNNTLNMALNGATRTWSTKHMGDMSSKLHEAKMTLQLANDYLDILAENADKLANEKITNEEILKVLDEMFPSNEEMSNRQRKNAETIKDGIVACMYAPDLIKFLNTKWGFINAVSDYVGHANPTRLTENYAENNWGRIMNGHPILDRAMSLIKGE